MMSPSREGYTVNDLKTLLLVVDPTVEHDPASDRCLEIARMTQAEVILFVNNENTLTERSYIYEGVDGAFFENQRKLFEEHYQKILGELQDRFQQAGIKVSSRFKEQHHLAEAIIKEAESSSPDLVIKSTHHHSTLERSLLSNTDWRLIRKCPAPLLMVKPGEWQAGGNIITAVDPLHSKAEQTRLDHVLLQAGEKLAARLNMQHCVFHSYYPFVSTLFPLGGQTREHLDRIREHHESKLLELLSDYEVDRAKIELSEGDLVPCLIKYLKAQQANLLVIGALSRNVLERAIVGNTAERILEDSPCDVLVLKS
jgi:universal stress protein E